MNNEGLKISMTVTDDKLSPRDDEFVKCIDFNIQDYKNKIFDKLKEYAKNYNTADCIFATRKIIHQIPASLNYEQGTQAIGLILYGLPLLEYNLEDKNTVLMDYQLKFINMHQRPAKIILLEQVDHFQ